MTTRDESVASLVAFIGGHSFGSVQSLAETLYDRQIVPLLADVWDEAVGWFTLLGPLNGNQRISMSVLLEAEEANPYRVQP